MFLDLNILDDYDLTPVYNTVRRRKFQPNTGTLQNTLSLNSKGTELQKLSAKRAELLLSKNTSRNYGQKMEFGFDEVNELERMGGGSYNRKYHVLVSLEDSLDFFIQCIFKTKKGSVKESLESKGFNYQLFSRQLLGGGEVSQFSYSSLLGINKNLDTKLINMALKLSEGSKNFNYGADTLEGILIGLVDKIRLDLIYCVNKKFTEEFGGDIILASIGMTSLLFYSNIEIDEKIQLRFKCYSHSLKPLCYEPNTYNERLGDYLCYL